MSLQCSLNLAEDAMTYLETVIKRIIKTLLNNIVRGNMDIIYSRIDELCIDEMGATLLDFTYNSNTYSYEIYNFLNIENITFIIHEITGIDYQQCQCKIICSFCDAFITLLIMHLNTYNLITKDMLDINSDIQNFINNLQELVKLKI